MRDELVSVIIPVFNVQNYLETCLNSILQQTYKNLEIILVDDGSTDSSGTICDRYAKKDSRVHVIHQLNRGLSEARNQGIQSSKGRYISLIDSDDFIEANFIKNLLEVMQKTDSDMVCTVMLPFPAGKEEHVKSYWERIAAKENIYHTFAPMELLELSLYQSISVTGAQQKLYKRELFNQTLFPAGRYFEDLATTYQYILQCRKIAVLEHKLYAYRLREDSILNKSFNNRKMDCVWVAEKIVKDITQKCPQLESAARCAAFRVNRLVFYLIPRKCKEERKRVWSAIVKYRRGMIKDSKVQAYEKMLAASSYGGKLFFCCTLKVFQKVRAVRYGFRQ